MEADKYLKGVEWLTEAIYKTKFTAERIKIIAQRMASNVTTSKRKGQKVVATVLKDLIYSNGGYFFTMLI